MEFVFLQKGYGVGVLRARLKGISLWRGQTDCKHVHFTSLSLHFGQLHYKGMYMAPNPKPQGLGRIDIKIRNRS